MKTSSISQASDVIWYHRLCIRVRRLRRIQRLLSGYIHCVIFRQACIADWKTRIANAYRERQREAGVDGREIPWKEQRERERKGGRSALEATSCAMDIHSRWMGIERSRSHSRTIIGRRANGSKRARQAEGSGGGSERGRGMSPCKSHHRSNTACILNVTW